MKSTNPELVYLYRQYSYCQKRRIPIPCDIQRSIDELQGSPVILSTITQNKEQQLRETIGNFEQLLKEGITKAEAARRLGYDYPTIWKMYETLKRIESERKTGTNEFKQALKNPVGNYVAKTSPTVAEVKNIGLGYDEEPQNN